MTEWRFTHGKCDSVINAIELHTILVLRKIELLNIWVWVVWLYTASGIFLFLLSFTYLPAYYYTVSMDCSLRAVLCRNDTAEFLTHIMVGSLLCVAQAISWFRMSRVSKHLRFFLSCINFSNNSKTDLHFFLVFVSSFLLNTDFCSTPLTAIFWKIIFGKGQKEGKGGKKKLE